MVVLVLILIGYPFGKTLWDWLELLIVPLALAVGGYWFNSSQDKRQDAIERTQKVRQDAIEEKRRLHDNEIATQRARDAALLSFLDHMSQLLMEKDLQPMLPEVMFTVI